MNKEKRFGPHFKDKIATKKLDDVRLRREFTNTSTMKMKGRKGKMSHEVQSWRAVIESRDVSKESSGQHEEKVIS